MIDDCRTCGSYKTCREPCEEVETYASQDEVGEDRRLVFVPEPKRFAGPKPGVDGTYRAPVSPLRWRDNEVYETKMLKEKEALMVWRPLIQISSKARLIYIEMTYFGGTKDDLAKLFKIKRSRLNDYIREAEALMGPVQTGEAVS